MFEMKPPPENVYSAALEFEQDAKKLTADIGKRMAEVLVLWVRGLKARVEQLAKGGGIPTTIPLSPVTVALKGSSAYGYDEGGDGRGASRLWEAWEYASESGTDWARAWGLPTGAAAHSARALYPNWLLFSRLSHVPSGGIILTKEQKQVAAAYIRSRLRAQGLTEEIPHNKARVYYVPARHLIPPEIWQEELSRLSGLLSQVVGTGR